MHVLQCVSNEAIKVIVNITSLLNILSAHDNSASVAITAYLSGKGSWLIV